MSDCHPGLLIFESRDCTFLLSSCACHFPLARASRSLHLPPNSRPCLHKFNEFFSHQQQWRWSSGQDTASICLANTRHVGGRGEPPRGVMGMKEERLDPSDDGTALARGVLLAPSCLAGVLSSFLN